MKKNVEYTISYALLLITLAVNVSMPLFRVYAQNEGLNNGQTALVLASYIVGMLPCYIFLGGVSDKIGRKKIMIVSVLFSLLSTTVITFYPEVYALVIARFCQGIALGLSMGTGTAYLTEILNLKQEKHAATQAANMASFSTAIGFSGGALTTTLLIIHEFTLVPLSYPILIGLTIIGLLLMLFLPDLPPIGGKVMRLPFFPENSLPVNIGIGVCWAVTGIVIAIIPGQLAAIGLTSYAGFCLVLVNWTGAFLQPFIRNYNPKKSVQIGYLLIPLGFGLVILGCHLSTLFIILIGASIIGMAAYGFSYLGGLAIISNIGGEQRARAIAGFMFVGYIGFGIPAIFLGYLSDALGIVRALVIFEAIIVLIGLYFIPKVKYK
ncbi:MFS transporter [Flectobacillus longus]|uniref:MFS transporter n=1 Tax=Flectobacillus longus TaxID=2984207 RepID=UPI0024B664E0|nr:MFS transporter [Flectobacillus longus]MDI9880844.1 MFS transporter [Flectobacillus longus]